MVKLLGISGSLRAASLNTKLLGLAVASFAPDEFVRGSIDLPLYDGDLEAKGIPEGVQLLADQIAAADAVVIASPEYNQNVPGGLKNALDWVSRVDGNPWDKKPVAVIHAAAGRAGGARCSYSLRLCLQPFNPMLLQGPEVLVAAAHEAFDDAGQLKNERYQKALDTLMADLRALV